MQGGGQRETAYRIERKNQEPSTKHQAPSTKNQAQPDRRPRDFKHKIEAAPTLPLIRWGGAAAPINSNCAIGAAQEYSYAHIKWDPIKWEYATIKSVRGRTAVAAKGNTATSSTGGIERRM